MKEPGLLPNNQSDALPPRWPAYLGIIACLILLGLAAFLLFGNNDEPADASLAADTSVVASSAAAAPPTTGAPATSVVAASSAPTTSSEASETIPSPSTTSAEQMRIEVLEAAAKWAAAEEARSTTTAAPATTPPAATAVVSTGPRAPEVNVPIGGGVSAPPGPSGRALPPYLGIMAKLVAGDTNGRPEGGAAPPDLGPTRAPLTGLPTGRNNRPAIVAKIDNGSGGARPQAGLGQADIVYEQRVEGGVTRFAAVFHSQSPGTIGPIRSGRTSDIGVTDSMSTPIFAWGGSNEVFVNLLRQRPLVDRGSAVFGSYARSSARRAPHNLFTDTNALWASAGGSAPRAHFTYRADNGPLRNPATPASSVSVNFGGNQVEFRWTGAGWARFQKGSAHLSADGNQIVTQNVVVQEIEYVDTGLRDTANSVVPEAVMVGRGRALVFTNGAVIEGKWTKAAVDHVTRFTDTLGNPIEFTPGTTFVELTTAGTSSHR